MQPLHDYDYSTLKWVKGEIDASLKAAKEALEGYFENDDPSLMRISLERLHEVQGTLHVVDVEGAARLAEEMEDTGRALLDLGRSADEDKREAIVESLMRGMLQLPGYLERVQDGHRDIPAALLPVFNDLRGSIDREPLTEADLFTPSLNVIPPRSSEAEAEDPRSAARRLRTVFQTGLVGWLRGVDREQSLQKFGLVFETLAKACALPAAGRLWWVASGLVEALGDEGISDQAAVSPLFPKLDRQIKLLLDEGEAALANADATGLISKMLYLVGRSSSHGTRVEDLRAAFALDQLLPSEEEIQEFEGSLSGATVALMDTVAEALREDLRSVMEPLDVFTRNRDRNVVELRGLAQRLDDIADTLAMLGVASGRDRLRAQSKALVEMVTGERDVTNETLSAVATGLLAVENGLGGVGADDGDTSASHAQAKLRSAVMVEARRNLEQIKEQIVEFIGSGGGTSLHGALKRFDEVRGGLVVLEEPRAAELVLRCESYLHGALMATSGVPAKQQIETFAESVAGLEYYLEAVDEGLGGQKEILDSIERALNRLPDHPVVETPVLDLDEESRAEPDEVDAASLATPTIAMAPVDLDVPEAEAHAELLEIDDGAESDVPLEGIGMLSADSAADARLDMGFDAGGQDLESDPQPSEPVVETGEGSADSLVAATPAERRFEMPEVAIEADADPELVEIFLEEADEEIRSIGRNYPEWRSAPDDHEALGNLRRSFHTLKGSGRMVGAWLMGEYAWAFENMFNRILEDGRKPTPDMFRLVEAGTAALPELIGQLQSGSEPTLDVGSLMDGAWALQAGEALPAKSQAAIDACLSGRDAGSPAVLASEAEAETAVETASEAEIAERDPVLMEIFKEEAQGHIETIRTYVAEAGDQPQSAREVSDGLLRALHTIHGSGRMAEVNEVAELAGGLECYVKDVAAARMTISDDALTLLDDSAEALDIAMRELDVVTDVLPQKQALLDRLLKLSEVMPSEEARSATADAPGSHLQEVFLSDAADILQTADDNFKQWCGTPEAHEPLAELSSDLDTLASGAELVGIAGLSVLAAREHRLVDLVLAQRLAFSGQLKDLLGQVHDRLWALLESNREGIAGSDDGDELFERMDALIAQAAEPMREDSVTPAADEEVAVAQDREVSQPLPVTYEDSFPADVDMELLEAFLDEGDDLLGTTDALVSRLSNDVGNHKLIDELRRSLHTLKGGARMVGLMTMGNLSHVLESMVQGVVDGHLPASERMFELLQVSHDTLAVMLDRARETKPLPKVDLLLQQVDDLLTRTISSPEIEALGEQVGAERKQALLKQVDAPEAEPASAKKAEKPGAAERRGGTRIQQEQVRVRADLLNQLVNFAGEVSISRSRIEEQITGFRFNLRELEQTITRLREQLRNLEIETEAQILFRHDQEVRTGQGDFDPLEMDRYSTVQQLSRQLMESVSDFVSLHALMLDQTREAETLLLQQSRVNTELQEGLIRTRMVPFSGLAPRLRRIVRQTSKELGKKAELKLEGVETEVDRTVLDRMVAPLEHLLRNSVNHGIETPAERKKAGKPQTGLIRISLTREGQEVVIGIHDDGNGLNLSAIKRKAVERGLMKPGAPLSDKEVMHFILESGFSTATSVTQIAGRGVGMDVVNNEIKQLSGSLDINSIEGRSTALTIRLPLTLTVSQALLVNVHEQNYAIPLSSIQSVIQLSKREADTLYASTAPRIERGKRSYQFVPMPLLLDQPVTQLQNDGDRLPVLLFSAGEINVALSVDALIGVQEIVVKSVGSQLGRVREISGATILGDGRVVLILDMGSLLRKVVALHGNVAAADHLEAEEKKVREGIRVMVVDDSITVRKITQRVLERNNMTVVTARDGVDAATLLEEEDVPDIIVTDIEMPRMDGYELSTLIRNDIRLSHIPIIMITSRTGAKHRDRAEAVGVNRYLGKPFQETDLLATINSLVQVEKV